MKRVHKADEAKTLRWFVTGIAVAFALEWFCNGGFNNHTDVECITILLTIGIAYGMWVENWLQK